MKDIYFDNICKYYRDIPIGEFFMAKLDGSLFFMAEKDTIINIESGEVFDANYFMPKMVIPVDVHVTIIEKQNKE